MKTFKKGLRGVFRIATLEFLWGSKPEKSQLKLENDDFSESEDSDTEESHSTTTTPPNLRELLKSSGGNITQIIQQTDIHTTKRREKSEVFKIQINVGRYLFRASHFFGRKMNFRIVK
jgi:hypothetical protein